MQSTYGEKVKFAHYGQRRSLAQRLGLASLDAVVGAVEDRALWARYGL